MSLIPQVIPQAPFRDAQKIKGGINPRINFTEKKELDFGFGFYMADRKGYAIKTAKSKAKGTKGTGRYDAVNDRPVLLTLVVDIDGILAECGSDALILRHKNLDFLDKVFEARFRCAGVDTINKRFVVAPIADGNVDDVMQWYRRKPWFCRRAWAYFRYWLPVLSRQFVLKDVSLCKFVSIVREETSYEKSSLN